VEGRSCEGLAARIRTPAPRTSRPPATGPDTSGRRARAVRSGAAGTPGRVAVALRAAKEAIDQGLEADIDTGLAIERTWFAGLFATADRENGMRSFVEEGPGKAKFA
jgi:enoyl-CoA hydratase/carnithine racemase